MRQNELRDAAGFGPIQRRFAGAELNVIRLPIGGPVAVHVVPAGAVFVDLAIAIVIDALGAGEGKFAFFAFGRALDDARIIAVAAVFAVGVEAPHDANVAIAIEIFG